jgi:Phosphoribosyl-ATP pyrophosphohydrolase
MKNSSIKSSIFKSLFDATVPSNVTRRQLVKKLEELSRMVDDLSVSLYMANPRHPLFNEIGEGHQTFLQALRVNYPGRLQNFLADVDDFGNKFDLPKGVGQLEDEDHVGFRFIAMREELVELRAAIDQRNHAEILDALVDLTYFVLGTARTFGFLHVFGLAWERVHNANMRKVRAASAEQSKRGSGFDVVKPEGWVAPDLSDLVQFVLPAKNKEDTSESSTN